MCIWWPPRRDLQSPLSSVRSRHAPGGCRDSPRNRKTSVYFPYQKRAGFTTPLSSPFTAAPASRNSGLIAHAARRLLLSQRPGNSFWSRTGRSHISIASSSGAPLVWRRYQVSVFQDRRQLVPFDLVVDAYADPSLFAHIWRNEKPLRIRVDQNFLSHRRRPDPHCHVAAVVMIVVGHREHASADDTKRTLAPGLLLEDPG